VSGALGIDLIRQALLLSLQVAGPMLLTALVVGVLVSLVQAITQLQEQTLTFIPKLLAISLVFLLTLPWAIATLVGYLSGILRSLPTLVAS
jgi:flagellar biosynthetic protein FliQ